MLLLSQTSAQAYPASGQRLGSRLVNKNTITAGTFESIAGHANATFTGANAIGAGGNALAIWGASGPFIVGSPQRSNLPSWVFYRFYAEDLTVSGRTYATADALDYAAFVADVQTSGGRYYGDTYTDPATLL